MRPPGKGRGRPGQDGLTILDQDDRRLHKLTKAILATARLYRSPRWPLRYGAGDYFWEMADA